MKYRIVERKKANGEIYYIIQHRFLWLWWNFGIDKIYELGNLDAFIHRFAFWFESAEQAKTTLERVQRAYNYKGITIYPTINENVFYTFYGAKKHKSCDWYETLIYGSYESCCKQIDELSPARESRTFRGINMKELKITATTEQEFREQAYEIAKSVNTTDELAEFINFISNTPLDYGTAVYAQCAAMLAAQHVMNESEQGGITGFQAGFIGWEMVKKFMIVGDCGLSLRDWENMLYPQYGDSFEKTIPRKIFEGLQEKAKERLAKADEDDSITGHSLHPEVRNHMESIVNGVVPFGYVIKED